jgi:hypothetical protein
MFFLAEIVTPEASRLNNALSASCLASSRVLFQPTFNGRSLLSQTHHCHSVRRPPHSVMINLNIVKTMLAQQGVAIASKVGWLH